MSGLAGISRPAMSATTDNERMDATITLHTDGLYSKWGFGDGDVLDDVLYDLGYGDQWEKERAWINADHSRFSFDHRVLIRVVHHVVVPALAAHHQIGGVYTIHTIHNPVRATHCDGVEIDTYNGPASGLTPATVEVPVDLIKTIAEQEAAVSGT
jgi:hypothetical protein